MLIFHRTGARQTLAMFPESEDRKQTTYLSPVRSGSAQFVALQNKVYNLCRKLVVGDPTAEGTFMGALISTEHLNKVKGYVDIARKEGATILCGEEALNLPDKNKNVSTCS